MKAILTTVLLFAATATLAADLYVAPGGNDANPGTAEKPLATLRGARDAIRAMKAAGPMAQVATVYVAEGTYTCTEPLTLEPQDSGTAQSPITYQAAAGAHPLFSGGRAISGWQPADKGIWKTHIAEVAAGRWYFEQLFVNGNRATRARTPNKFFFYMQDLHETRFDPAAKGRRGEAQQTVRMRPEDAQQAFGHSRPEDLHDVNLIVYHNWDNTRRFLDSIDTKHGLLTTSGEAMKPWNPWTLNSHYVLENYLGALDSPGEWFLARDGWLYYMPRPGVPGTPGEDMAKAEVVAPVAEKFLVLKGDAAAGKFVEHVAFRGLAFRHGQWLTPPRGFEPMQAAAQIEAAVMADAARHVTIEDCEIGCLGTYAVWFRHACHDCAVRHCHIHDFGAGAVRIGETAVIRDDVQRTGHITIDNNIMRHGGSIFPCAVGLWIGQSGDNTVAHNEIADLFYTGISAGWTWGYHEGLAKRNTFAFNHVHHLGWGLMSDMGGIYTLGPSEGTVVRNNVFHDIYSHSYGGWGMYTDEGSTGILMENNLVYRTKTGSFHQHYGKENVLRNNILAESKEQQIQATRLEDHLSFTLEKNIVYWETGTLLAGPWDKLHFASRDNLYWQARHEPFTFAGRTLAAWQAQGHEEGSQIADPRFVDPAHDDYRLAPDSPVLRLGFKPFDPALAGVYGDETWKAKARAAKYPPMEVPPGPPPTEIDDDFEDQPVGSQPSGAVSHVENRGDAIVVTDETAAGGKHSVKIVDAPGLQNVFDPHLTYENLGHVSGRIRNSFDLRVAKDARLNFEWRDYGEPPYATGPQFGLNDLRLTFGGRQLAMPADTWIHFEIVAGLADAAKDGWTLRVVVPGQPPQEFRGLAMANPRFKKLDWIGFSSEATYKTAFYIDNLVLKRDSSAGATGATGVAGTVKVFILAGQSNMEGKAPNALLDYQAEDPKTSDLFKHLRKDGKWIVRDDVFIKYLDRKGPLTIGYGSPGRTGVELEFGTMMGDRLHQPVLLIKTAWGGHSLVKLFRSPSAGYPAEAVLEKELQQAQERVKKENEKRKKADPLPTMDDIKKGYGSSYRAMLAEVRETFDNYETLFPALKGKKLELAGFVWFQGWNDQYGGAEKEYASNMKHFIEDVRKDLRVPHLPFVIAAMGQNGSKPAAGAMLAVREAQLSMNDVPEFKGNVKAFRTDVLVDKAAEELYPSWEKNLEQWKKTGGDHGYHYLGSAIWFNRIGKAMGQAMLELIPGASPTL